MKNRLADLVRRRCLLLEKIGAQRNELTQLSGHFERPLAWVDTGLRTARYLHNHPAVLASGLATLLALPRSGLLGFAKTTFQLLWHNPSILSFAWQALSKSPRHVVKKGNKHSI
jgi:YqjK-like protein